MKREFISFQQLYMTDFNLTDLFGMQQKWTPGTTFHMSYPRKTTGIIFLNGCSGKYTTQHGEIIDAPQKSLVCLPSGSVYSVVNLKSGASLQDAFLIEFNAISNERILTFSDSPFLIPDVNTSLIAELCQKVIRVYETPAQSPLEVKSAVYNLLTYLGKEKFQKYQKKFSPIIPGIELLEENPLSDLSIAEIAAACNVSVCYFRKLFHEYSGKSPLQYRMDLRLGKAKNMLENSNTPLEYIADTLGFESSSYFCKLFKKKTGMTPTEYRNQQIYRDLI